MRLSVEGLAPLRALMAARRGAVVDSDGVVVDGGGSGGPHRPCIPGGSGASEGVAAASRGAPAEEVEAEDGSSLAVLLARLGIDAALVAMASVGGRARDLSFVPADQDRVRFVPFLGGG